MAQRKAADSPTKNCTAPDCGRPLRARGLCHMHWKREHGKRTKYPVTCVTCGVDHLSDRPDGKFCSDECKGKRYSITHLTKCPLPDDHPAMLLMAEAKRLRCQAQEAEREQRTTARLAERLASWRTARECPGCGCTFSPLFTSNMLVCSKRCSRRVHRWIRRAREHDAPGSFTWSEFMHIARRFDYRCAYCGSRPGRLDPDHVVPLSRGGINSTTNLLPSCNRCNGDKRDLLLHEWADKRALSGKPALATHWAPEDKRYWHLTQAMLTGTSPAA